MSTMDDITGRSGGATHDTLEVLAELDPQELHRALVRLLEQADGTTTGGIRSELRI